MLEFSYTADPPVSHRGGGESRYDEVTKKVRSLRSGRNHGVKITLKEGKGSIKSLENFLYTVVRKELKPLGLIVHVQHYPDDKLSLWVYVN